MGKYKVEPITPLTLLIYAPAFLVMSALYGNPFRVFFEKSLNEKNIVLDAVERVALTLASGAAVIPLIIMILSLLGNVLDVFVARMLTIFFILANLYLYRERLKSFKPKLIKLSMKAAIVLATFSAIFIFHLYPSIGLFVHPGNDPSYYSLVTLRIVENGGYAMSWGSFAPQSWYVEKIHLTIAGFSGTAAFFHLLTALSIEKVVFLITLLYTSLISLGVYFLAKRLFKNAGIALCSAFVFGMLIQEPGLIWFGWGGHAELSSLFLLPIIIGLFWEIFRNNQIGFRYILHLGFLLSGMSMLHPLSAFYLAFCLTPFFLIFICAHRKIAPVLKSLAVFLIAIALILPIFIPAVMAEMTYNHVFASRPSPWWSAMISWNQSPDQMLYSILWRFFAVYGVGTFFLLIAGIDVLRSYKIHREPLILLAMWALTLFLVHENTQTGLYIIPFPFWSRIEVNRVFTITSFSVSIISGIAMFKILECMMKKSLFEEGKFKRLKFMWKRARGKKAVPIILLLCILQVSINVVVNSNSRENSSVTKADIYAFDWIRNNTTPDALFFVSMADAGQWIPIFTHRRVLIPFGVVSNFTLYDQYYADYEPERSLSVYPTFVRDPHSLKCLEFLNYHNVNYVYIGDKTIYGGDEFNAGKFNASRLAKSPVFELVYNQSNVYIFEYLRMYVFTIWKDDDFLSGWNTGAAFGGTFDAGSDGDIYKLRATSGEYAYSTRSLSLNNIQTITYLITKWRTDGTAAFKVEVLVDGKPYKLIDRQTSSTWTTSVINLNNYAAGEIDSTSIFVDGDGYIYIDFIRFDQLVPLKIKE